MWGENVPTVLDDLQHIIVKQFTAQPAVSNIHAHALKRSFDGRVGHLPDSVGALRMRATSSGAEKAPADSSSGKIRTVLGLALFGSRAERNFDTDLGPEIQGIVDGGIPALWRKHILERGRAVRRSEGPEFVLVTWDLVLVDRGMEDGPGKDAISESA